MDSVVPVFWFIIQAAIVHIFHISDLDTPLGHVTHQYGLDFDEEPRIRERTFKSKTGAPLYFVVEVRNAGRFALVQKF